jgi:hypothetical protein
MDKQSKELLLKDLCARLPYGVVLKDSDGQILFLDGIVRCSETDMSKGYILAHEYNVTWSYERKVALCDIKPYLRPIESMTKKEMKEYSKFAHFGNTLGDWTKSIDYLYAHHIDFRGLIKKGLAVEAPDGIYRKSNNNK